ARAAPGRHRLAATARRTGVAQRAARGAPPLPRARRARRREPPPLSGAAPPPHEGGGRKWAGVLSRHAHGADAERLADRLGAPRRYGAHGREPRGSHHDWLLDAIAIASSGAVALSARGPVAMLTFLTVVSVFWSWPGSRTSRPPCCGRSCRSA